MGKLEYRGKEEGTISQMQCKPYFINLDEGFTAIKAQENNNNKRERQRQRERERERETHTYTLTQSYMRIYILMQYYGKLQ